MPDEAGAKAVEIPDSDAEQRKLEANLPLVYAIARRYIGRGTEFDDLVQLGSIGLLKAIRRFNPDYGVCFSTYAVPMIAGEIKRFLRDDGMIKFSRAIKELSAAVWKLRQQNPDLGVKELSELLHVTEADLAAALASTTLPRSLEEPDQNTGEPFGLSIAAKDSEPAVDDRLFLSGLTESLDVRERQLLHLRYRLDLTQSETGKRLGISQVQVSRMEKRILQKLRERSKT